MVAMVNRKKKRLLHIANVLCGIEMYVQRHPPVQADVDPEKKTIVVLGSGWASTSFLKDIDTDYYNVVSKQPFVLSDNL